MLKLTYALKIFILLSMLAQFLGCGPNEEYIPPTRKDPPSPAPRVQTPPQKQNPTAPGNNTKKPTPGNTNEKPTPGNVNEKPKPQVKNDNKGTEEAARKKEQENLKRKQEQERQDKENADAQKRRKEREDEQKKSEQEKADAKKKDDDKLKERKAKLAAFKTELEKELPALKNAKTTYDWASSLKFFFTWDPGTPMAKEIQEDLNSGSKPIRDNVAKFIQFRKEADFPKTYEEWNKTKRSNSNKYWVFFWDFLRFYAPFPGQPWEYDKIIKMSLERADNVDKVLNNTFTSKTKDYAQLKKEIEALLKNNKSDADRYLLVKQRISDIDKGLGDAIWLESDDYFNRVMKKI